MQQSKKSVVPVKDQQSNESRRVWYHVAKSIDYLKYEEANKYKATIEDAQRKKSEKVRNMKIGNQNYSMLEKNILVDINIKILMILNRK